MKNLFSSNDPKSEDTIVVTRKDLEKIWKEVVNNDDSKRALLASQHFIEAVELSIGKHRQVQMEMDTNGWKITIKKHLLKSLILSPTIGGLLYYLGYAQLAGILLPTLIPILFDIERVQLSSKEEEILIKLPVKEKYKKYQTAQQWYHGLPLAIRKQVNELDFVDFIDKLVLAGYATKGKNNKFRIHTKGNNRFKISFE